MGATKCTRDGSNIIAIKVVLCAGAASSQTAASSGAIGAGAASRKGPLCQLPCAAPFPPGGWEGFLHQALHNIWRQRWWPALACLAVPEQRRDDAHDV